MASYDLNNKRQVFVSKDVAATTATNISAMLDGEIALAEMNGTIMTTDSSFTDIKEVQIVTKKNGNLYHSVPISFKGLLTYTAAPYAAKVEKSVAIGYDGTDTNKWLEVKSNALVTNGTTYSLQVRKLEALKQMYDKFFWNLVPSWYSGYATSGTTTKTGYDLAVGLYEACATEMQGNIDGWIVPELITNYNPAADGTATTATVSEGSNIIVLNAAPTQSVGAGDLIRIAFSGAVGTTTATYVVKSISGTYVTLTTPITYTSTATSISGCNIKILLKSAMTAATGYLFGIRLTTTPRKYEVGRFEYDIFNFQLWASQTFTYAPITDLTAPSKGEGTYEETADLEYQAQHQEQYGRSENIVPYNRIPLNATSGLTYNKAVLTVRNSTEMFVIGDINHKANVIICFPKTANGQAQAKAAAASNAVIRTLDAWYNAWAGATVYDYTTGTQFNS